MWDFLSLAATSHRSCNRMALPFSVSSFKSSSELLLTINTVNQVVWCGDVFAEYMRLRRMPGVRSVGARMSKKIRWKLALAASHR
jgi:hypothetical protein